MQNEINFEVCSLVITSYDTFNYHDPLPDKCYIQALQGLKRNKFSTLDIFYPFIPFGRLNLENIMKYRVKKTIPFERDKCIITN